MQVLILFTHLLCGFPVWPCEFMLTPSCRVAFSLAPKPYTGIRLTGCRGCHRFFKLPIYRCGTSMTDLFHTPRIYSL